MVVFLESFTSEALILLLNFIFWFAILAVIGILYSKNRVKSYFSLLLSTFSMALTELFMFLSYMLNSIPLLGMATLIFQFAVYFGILFIDLMWNETPKVFGLSIITGLTFLKIYLIFLPESYYIEIIGDFQVPRMAGILSIVSVISLILGSLFFFKWLLFIWRKSPLQHSKIFHAIGIMACIFGPIAVILMITTKDVIFFSIVVTCCILYIAIVILKNPMIIYILPFEVNRLIVIDQLSGIPLFDYKWVSSKIDESLLSGLLKALNSISFEVLNQGEVVDLCLEKGAILIQKGANIIVGLLTSKSSNYLTGSLRHFSEEFELRFCGVHYNSSQSENFKPAEELIKKYFGNIPNR